MKKLRYVQAVALLILNFFSLACGMSENDWSVSRALASATGMQYLGSCTLGPVCMEYFGQDVQGAVRSATEASCTTVGLRGTYSASASCNSSSAHYICRGSTQTRLGNRIEITIYYDTSVSYEQASNSCRNFHGALSTY